MLVTCIIPTYQKFGFLFDALKSVLMQDYPEIELIITDDSSEVFDEEKIKDYIERNKRNNLVGYKLIRNAQNVGTVRNMNGAIKQASGDIIIPLAADDMLYGEKVISQIVSIFSEKGCEVLVCSRMKCSEDMKTEYRLMPHPSYIGYIRKHMNTAEKQYKSVAMGAGMEFASGAAMYYTKSYMQRRNYYDERYTLWEDGPFIAQAVRSGVTICTAYEIVSIRYRDGGISAKKSRKPNSIYYDYCKLIDNEFLSYPERFNKWETSILQGRLKIQKAYNTITPRIAMTYPLATYNYFRVKCMKAFLIVRHSFRRRLK